MNSYIDVYGALHCPTELIRIIDDIRSGFNQRLYPKLTDDGTSGAYRMRNYDKENIAIFKPIDEEPFAPNNPRGHEGPFGSQTFRPGVLSGESCIREVAAYLLDHKHFADVPPTTFVEVVHSSLKYVPFIGLEVTSEYFDILSSLITPVNVEDKDNLNNKSHNISGSLSKTFSDRSGTGIKKGKDKPPVGLKFGSLQKFVKSLGAVENFGSDKFSRDEVHKIAILDLRILNLDRNE
jgi:hypothetical protein